MKISNSQAYLDGYLQKTAFSPADLAAPLGKASGHVSRAVEALSKKLPPGVSTKLPYAAGGAVLASLLGLLYGTRDKAPAKSVGTAKGTNVINDLGTKMFGTGKEASEKKNTPVKDRLPSYLSAIIPFGSGGYAYTQLKDKSEAAKIEAKGWGASALGAIPGAALLLLGLRAHSPKLVELGRAMRDPMRTFTAGKEMGQLITNSDHFGKGSAAMFVGGNLAEGEATYRRVKDAKKKQQEKKP